MLYKFGHFVQKHLWVIEPKFLEDLAVARSIFAVYTSD